MVRTRIFFGTLLTVVFVLIIALDGWLTQQTVPDWSWLAGSLLGVVGVDFFLQGGVLTAVIALLTTWGVIELGRLCRGAGYQPAVVWACIAVFVLMILPWLSMTPVMGDRSPAAEFQYSLQWTALAMIVSLVWIMFLRPTGGAIANVAITSWLILYLGLLGSFVIRIRINAAGSLGAWLVLYHIAVTKFADIGAYFTGITLGRHPLAPSISPKKTIEGFVGGVVFSSVISLLLARLGAIIAPSEVMWLSTSRALVFGLVISIVGQVGDLVESLFKRDAKIKDSGALVPTFGGVLDIIDSPLFTAPVAWWLLMRWLTR